MKYQTRLNDTITLLDKDSSMTDEGRKGVVLGIVGTMVSSNYTFSTAITLLVQSAKNKYNPLTLQELLSVSPESWQEDIKATWSKVS